MEQQFTYLIRFLPTGQVYYGSRTMRGCKTSDLGTTYFSSSKSVKALISVHGVSQFSFEIRKTFIDKNTCLEWERRFLTKVDAARNPKFLNKHNAGRGFVGGPKTEETKKKLRLARTKQAPIVVTDEMKAKRLATRLEKNGGTYHSKTAIEKMRLAKAANPSPGHTGRVFSKEHIKNLSACRTGKKRKPWTEEQKEARRLLMTGIKRGPYKSVK